MKFIEGNIGKGEKVLVKAQYDRVIIVPFIVLGAVIILAGITLKRVLPHLVLALLGLSSKDIPEPYLIVFGKVVFIILLIAGVVYPFIMIKRTTGIEIAATESLLIGRYGKDTIRVPLEKIENFAVYRNLLGNIFKFGTVTIGTPSITIRIPYISDPEIFRDKVLELQDKRLS